LYVVYVCSLIGPQTVDSHLNKLDRVKLITTSTITTTITTTVVIIIWGRTCLQVFIQKWQFLPTRPHSFTCQNITIHTYQTTQLYCYSITIHTHHTSQFHVPQYKISYLPVYKASNIKTRFVSIIFIITITRDFVSWVSLSLNLFSMLERNVNNSHRRHVCKFSLKNMSLTIWRYVYDLIQKSSNVFFSGQICIYFTAEIQITQKIIILISHNSPNCFLFQARYIFNTIWQVSKQLRKWRSSSLEIINNSHTIKVCHCSMWAIL
jgi:hypothetical protein